MKTIKVIFVLSFLSVLIASEKIQESLSLCKKTEMAIDIPSQCEQLPIYDMLKCEIFKMNMNIFTKNDDQYNFVKSPNGNIVVYSLNRVLYVSSCITIEEFKIPEKVNKCTRDLPVIILENQTSSIVYLTKERILRYNSKEKTCNDDYEYFELSNIQIVRQSKRITSLRKNQKILTIFEKIENDKLKFIQKCFYDILVFYRNYFGRNENFLIFKDFFFIVLLIVIIFIILLKSKQPFLDLVKLLFIALSNIKNKKDDFECQKFEKNLDTIESCCSQKAAKPEQNVLVETKINELRGNTSSEKIDVITLDTQETTSKSIKVKSSKLIDHCNCKAGCKDNRCPCKQHSKFCNRKCHEEILDKCLNLNKL